MGLWDNMKRKKTSKAVKPSTGAMGVDATPENKWPPDPLPEVERDPTSEVGRPSVTDVSFANTLVENTTGILTVQVIGQLQEAAQEFWTAKENLKRAQATFEDARLAVEAMLEKVKNKIVL